VLPAAGVGDILSANIASLEHGNMHTFIRISGDDVPCGGLLFGTDTDTDAVLGQVIRDLRLAYPKASHCVVRGMDVVTDVVAGAAE
jgi:hypothetical protein